MNAPVEIEVQVGEEVSEDIDEEVEMEVEVGVRVCLDMEEAVVGEGDKVVTETVLSNSWILDTASAHLFLHTSTSASFSS